MRIMQLGNSAARPFKNGFNVSYLADLTIWTTTPQYLLMETPPSIMNQLAQADIDLSFIKWVYLSHQHGDHTLGLPMILVSEYARRSTKKWNVILQESMKQKIIELVLIAYPELEDYLEKQVAFHTIPDGKPFSLRITPEHSISTVYGTHGVPSTAIRVDGNNKSLVYSGDTGVSDAIAELAKKTDILIHEAGAGTVLPDQKLSPNHTCAVEAGKIAHQAAVKKLWLTHLDNNHHDFINRCIQLAANQCSMPVATEQDFVWITI